AILTQHITATPARPRDVAPQRRIPEAVENAILKSMAKEPDARFENMQALVNELTHIQMSVAPPPAPAKQGTGGYQPTLLTADVLAARGTPGRGTQVSGTRQPPPPTAGPVPATRVTGSATPANQSVAARPAYVEPPIVDASPPPRKSRAPLWIGLAGLMVLGGGGGGGDYYYSHYRATSWGTTAKPIAQAPAANTTTPPTNTTTPLANTTTPPGNTTTPLPVAPSTPKTIVLLDSVPEGASIIRDGQRLDETPANVEVTPGERVTFELHRDGSRDESI